MEGWVDSEWLGVVTASDVDLLQESEKVIDAWLKTPQDELIPVMKHMFVYSICTILSAGYDFSCDDDQQLVSSIRDSYDVVSMLLSAFSLIESFIVKNDSWQNATESIKGRKIKRKYDKKWVIGKPRCKSVGFFV